MILGAFVPWWLTQRPFRAGSRLNLTTIGGAFVFLAAFVAYVATLAPVQVPGDPSEYTFIPWILGIAHPPGYGFYTLAAAAWQRLVPIGTIAYRTHLFAAAAGATSALLVYALVLTIRRANGPGQLAANRLAAIFAALSFAFATDIWQHSIHANAHIVTLLLATASVFLLVRWRAARNDRWLYAFSLVAGLSPAQHPLLVFAFPAYAAFIVAVRPGILRQGRSLLKLLAFAAIGLSVFLYYPLRSPSTPFGAGDINSLDSFFHFVTAEGLRGNLFAFGLADQPARFSVFFNLLQLQYSLFAIALAVVGWLAVLRRDRPTLLLVSVFLVVLYVFVMNTIQDVMAYLMLPFMVAAVLLGIGAAEVLSVVLGDVFAPRLARLVTLIVALALIGLPVVTALLRAPRLTLREYTAGSDWVRAVYDRFEGKGEGAFLLAPWEALTPLWVEQYADDHPLDSRDVTLVYVAADSPNPWLEDVFAYFDRGPVYLADYRRQVVEGGLFRLRPEGGTLPVWRVVAPGDTGAPQLANALNATAENRIELLSYALDRTSLRAGETAYLTLAMRARAAPAHVLMPYALVGDRAYRWTTDSRALSPTWLPGEVIVERYEIALPFSMPPGDYPIALGVTDLTEGRDLKLQSSAETTESLSGEVKTLTTKTLRHQVSPRFLCVSSPHGEASHCLGDLVVSFRATSEVSTFPIGTLHVDAPRLMPERSGQAGMADFGAQAMLVGATATGNGQSARAASGQRTPALVVRPGQSIQVWLDWQALQQPLDNYKVFVHLITPGEQLAAPPADFYTPLGGAFPTHLWIPKWIEGQRVSDPYTLVLPPDIPPGEYRIQVGWYGLTSNRRIHIIGIDGSLAGDRVILGQVTVLPPNQ